MGRVGRVYVLEGREGGRIEGREGVKIAHDEEWDTLSGPATMK